ncbi:T9SS type A sorting domain-containing protein [Bacteroidota bacterium]
MKKALLYTLLILGILPSLRAQYISEVLEYVPAPSQYMNAAPWGNPSAPESLIGGITGSVSLGAFGGYIVFRFDHAVENDPHNPYGADFTLFGNPLPDWSEPGIVSVMKDENENGLPDDTWYELAGSDHFFSSTIRNYEVRYYNPGEDSAADVPWTDNLDRDGFIRANSYFSQPYYPVHDSFPGIDTSSYLLSGTRIKSSIDTTFEEGIFSSKRAFGYADNQFRGAAPYTLPDNPYTATVENSGGDAFDISWAIDKAGNYIELDRIHFVKVHSAVMDGAGWLGEVSTEITGAVDVAPDSTLKGETKILVIRDVPIELDTTMYQLEVLSFINGIPENNNSLNWESNLPGVMVDENNVLHASQSGDLTLKASLHSDNQISTSVSTRINLGVNVSSELLAESTGFSFYPNPAHDRIRIAGEGNTYIRILDLRGKIMLEKAYVADGSSIDIGHIPEGVYIIQAQIESRSISRKLIVY